jgi:transaldolase
MRAFRRLKRSSLPDAASILPSTLQAFMAHGQAALTIEEDLEAARVRITSLPTLGVDLDAVTRKLLDDGVAAFAASLESLLSGIESKRKRLLA